MCQWCVHGVFVVASLFFSNYVLNFNMVSKNVNIESQ